MAWYDWLTGKAEFNLGNNIAGSVFNKLTGNPSADERRNQQQMIADQAKAYKDQTELTRQQLQETRNSEDTEKRRVQEKQIRSLRRNYRAQGIGMLGTGQPAAQDMNTQLGG